MSKKSRQSYLSIQKCLTLRFLILFSFSINAGSYAMLYYKNNYHQAVDCWVNGIYQGVIPANTTKYMPAEGFVTRGSGWQKDGTLKHTHAYGGWSPTSPARVVTVAISGLGNPIVMWDSTFQAAESGLNLKVSNLNNPIDRYDLENAEGMFKGEPKDLAMLLGDKQFAPKNELDGVAGDGTVYAAKIESKNGSKKVIDKITIDRVRGFYDSFKIFKWDGDINTYEVKLMWGNVELDRKKLQGFMYIDQNSFYSDGTPNLKFGYGNESIRRLELYEVDKLRVIVTKTDGVNTQSSFFVESYSGNYNLCEDKNYSYTLSIGNKHLESDEMSGNLSDYESSEKYKINLKGDSIEFNFKEIKPKSRRKY